MKRDRLDELKADIHESQNRVVTGIATEDTEMGDCTTRQKGDCTTRGKDK